MSCSAKLPIYAILSSAFFPGHGGLVLVCLYLFAILAGIVVALVGRLMHRGNGAAPFVLELPNYRLPQMRNVLHLLSDKTVDFIRRAFTVIFLATLVIWCLQTFDWRMNMVSDTSASMLAAVAGCLSPLFTPIGLGDWRVVTALISGFLAKESVVSSMEVLVVVASLTPLTAISLLVFCLLYTPCVAAIAAVRRELGAIWAGFMIVFQCAVAWVAALGVYAIAGLLL